MFAYIKSWLVSLLQTMGFLNKKATVVMMGLDNTGKTTLLQMLKTGSVKRFVPTQRAKEETIYVGGVTIKAYDLGGHLAARHLWKRYSAVADGLVFMVDAADADRIAEARDELHRVLLDEEMATVPLVVMGNKSDLKHAMSREETMRRLDIDDSVKVFMTSVVLGTGYLDAFRWLSSQIP